MFLYHMVIQNELGGNISPNRVLKEGLNHRTATRWYSRGANFFPELTERCRPVNVPKWIDFNVAFGADLEPHEKPYYRFPVFSEKILVFNFDLSSDLFSYIEDSYDGGRGYFVEGLPSKENLMKQYWDSMLPLSEYLEQKPYNNPELYIFEEVPAKLISYIE
ncbi:hypothetical protein [Metabacillus malikii]|uniref:Uncharacterized protein n=1 Tax=Metabacillus malikii TaxID=1504265 RepID=A0ABT9ZLG2_9BACI|nr:hypothetical protein [Metabacillus malikii]MDQ0232626.1 hypothetical protein [Metabacillus malikii]